MKLQRIITYQPFEDYYPHYNTFFYLFVISIRFGLFAI